MTYGEYTHIHPHIYIIPEHLFFEALPALHPAFGKSKKTFNPIYKIIILLLLLLLLPTTVIPTKPQGGNHTPAFAQAAARLEAHRETITVTKALALIGFKVIADKVFFDQVNVLLIDNGGSGYKRLKNFIIFRSRLILMHGRHESSFKLIPNDYRIDFFRCDTL